MNHPPVRCPEPNCGRTIVLTHKHAILGHFKPDGTVCDQSFKPLPTERHR